METNLSCGSCGRKVSRRVFNKIVEHQLVKCTCGNYLELEKPGSVTVAIAENALPIAKSVEVTRHMPWFHLTTSEVFDPDRREMHVGTIDTIREYRRLKQRDGNIMEDYRLWVLAIAPSSYISSHVYEDDNRWSPVMNDLGRVTVGRYINKWEGPGQISLIGRASNFVLLGELSAMRIPRVAPSLSDYSWNGSQSC